MVTPLRLCPLRLEDEKAARLAHAALAGEYAFLLDHDPDEPWADFVARDARQRQGVDLLPGRVPAVFLVAWSGDEIVGRASIRLELNEYLATAGGHFGYAVLPEHRRRGHATEILRQSLIVARAAGIEDALVTCALDNVGSRTVIERCGGEFDSIVHDQREGVDSGATGSGDGMPPPPDVSDRGGGVSGPEAVPWSAVLAVPAPRRPPRVRFSWSAPAARRPAPSRS